jgi:hypothetical protein
MTTTLATQLFAKLTEKEVVRFDKFLRSPYFNRRDDVQLLHKILMATAKLGFENTTKEAVFAQLFPDTPFDRVQFNYVVNFYTERLEQFFANEELLSDPFQNELYRLKAFRKRGMQKHFDENARKLVQEHAAAPHRNASWWLLEYQLQNEKFSQKILHQRGGDNNFVAATEALTNFFMLENIRWSATSRALASLTREDQLPVPLAEETLRIAGEVSESDNPALALLYASLRALQDPDDTVHFQRLKNLLRTHVGLFPPAESRDLYMAAINFAIRRHNKGEQTYTQEAFDLYREALEINVLPENGVLPKYTFINILNLAQLVGNHVWARGFLESGKELLLLNERESTYRYGLAGYHFRRSEYTQVLDLLRSVEFSEVFINLDIRKMLLRSYFELGEWSALGSLLDSFKAFLSRQKDLGYHRESYLNLIKFTKKIEKTMGKRTSVKRVLAEKIRITKAVAEREWLLGKLG